MIGQLVGWSLVYTEPVTMSTVNPDTAGILMDNTYME